MIQKALDDIEKKFKEKRKRRSRSKRIDSCLTNENTLTTQIHDNKTTMDSKLTEIKD